MKCPLFQAGWLMKDNVGTSSEADCLEDDCAWWYKENNTCAIVTLAQGSTYIHKVLLTLANKMPKDLAPTGR